MPLRSPTELILTNAPPAGTHATVVAVQWTARPSFGPYLRELREAAGLSLRAAADEVGVSFSYLSKMETGERPNPPSMKVLQRIADAYGRDLRELMHEAGFRFETPTEIDTLDENLDERFNRLVMHPLLRPMLMDAGVVAMTPQKLKRQVIELALKLERAVRAGELTVDDVLRGESADASGPGAPAKNKGGTR